MKLESLTKAQLTSIGLTGARLDDTADTLTFRFTNREEVWTRAPAGYPVDGSREVCSFRGVFYVPPPTGRSS